MGWCVAVVHLNCELRAQMNLASQGFESYAPKVRQRVIERGKKVYREKFLFSRYMFVNFVQQWRAICSTHGVAQLLMDGERPALVPEREIVRLRASEKNGCVSLPKLKYRVGQSVVVETGELMGLSGLYHGMSQRDRDIVLINMLGRFVKVELAADDRIASV